MISNAKFELGMFNSILRNVAKKDEIRSNAVLALQYFMRDSETGNPIVLCDMQMEWHYLWDGHRFCLVVAPRGHGKTENVDGRVCKEIGINNNLRIKIISGTEDLAKKRVKAIKEIIEFNPKYHELYGRLKPTKATNWGDLSFTVKRTITGIKESTVEAFGIMGTATGDRADIIVCDDICNFENTIGKPTQRAMIKQKFWDDVMKWLVPKTGRLWFVCTLWHQDDLSSELKNNLSTNGFKMKFYAINDNCDPLWEEKWDRETLRAEELKNRPSFDRAYRNRPISDADATFKRDTILHSIRIDEPSVLVDGNYRIYVGVDLAISKKTTADWTVIFVLAVHKTLGLRVPVKIIRGRFTSPETARKVLDVTKQYRPDMIYVENNQYQQSLIQWIKDLEDKDEWKEKQWAIPNILGYRTGNQKHDPYEGLPSLASEFANGMWVICNHVNPLLDGGSYCTNDSCLCRFIDELSSYPYGVKDDIVMAAWLARESARVDSGFFIGTTEQNERLKEAE